jgi:hypothetical protein
LLLDNTLLDRKHMEHSGHTIVQVGHTGLSPWRWSQSSLCFTTVTPAGAKHAERSEGNVSVPRVEIVGGRNAHDFVQI